MTITLDSNQSEFLSQTRLGVLITLRDDGSPIGVPVWFDWNGTRVQMFADKDSRKIARLKRNPSASLLVMNHIDEPENWITFDGSVEIEDSGGIELAEKLARQYWDMSDEKHIKELAGWQAVPDAFYLLTLTPSKIRGY